MALWDYTWDATPRCGWVERWSRTEAALMERKLLARKLVPSLLERAMVRLELEGWSVSAPSVFVY
jgi:hypothetical protein